MIKDIKSSGLLDIIKEKYEHDTILVVATSRDNVPNVRSVDSFFYDGSFWIVTDLRANYAKEIKNNPYVMISDAGHNRFWCKASIVGHPLDESNLEIRKVYEKVFHNWYHEVNNEEIDTVCYIKVTPYKGYVHKDKLGYTFDLTLDKVTITPITHHIDVKLEPFW